MKIMKNEKIKPRDLNILKSIKGEIDLRTKSESNKPKKFTRKIKHKNTNIHKTEV